ncbi:MAG: M23 family metallopeptidase [Bacteroidales bacterium]|nr:M23 family metallopeptidase [Bacteroidales bacterium]
MLQKITMRSIYIVLFVIIQFTCLSAQVKTSFRAPLDIPLVLSGNFGELRSNHFHSGIDIRTNGNTGYDVFSVDSGYVSRIKIQTEGFGKALYVDHRNGYTSVYAHLDNFSPEIEKYIKKIQYQKKTHAIDVYLKPGTINISKGQIIGFSGNTGSSSGPHLHFEIRKSRGQVPTNCLFYDLPVEDSKPPHFFSFAVYQENHRSMLNHSGIRKVVKVKRNENGHQPADDLPITVSGKVGIGVEVYDYLDKSRNRCGIFSLELLVDGKRYYYYEMNEFSFSESRFINAHIDYELKSKEGKTVQRLFKLPYNTLSIYKFMENDGWIEIQDTLIHNITIIAKDSYGNMSDLKFRVKGTGTSQALNTKSDFTGRVLPYNAQSEFKDRNINISFPAYCFYEDLPFSFLRTKGTEELYSDIYYLHNEHTPVHRNFSLSITPTKKYGEYSEKLCIVKVIDREESQYVGGEFENGRITADTREFGKYAISMDTAAPTIVPVNHSGNQDLSSLDQIVFRIKDDLSGIASYNGYIDDEWVLFEFDPKNELLYHEFDPEILISEKNHDLEIHLTDDRGNKTLYKTKFYR